ncbi:MAG: hypothetical protein ACK52I_37440 [Pseudomonadota bacterium]|jgi:hypothetical protein
MGLLDLMNRPGVRQGLGLLAAAGPSPVPMSFGQRAMGLLGQMDAEKRAEEERQAQAQMRALQQQLLQAQLGERQDMAAERQAQRAAQQAQQQRMADFNARLRPNASAALSGGGGPTVENAAKLSQGPDLRALALEFPELIGKIKELDSVRNLGLDEVARTIEARGADGMPVTEQRDKFGRLVGPAIPKAVQMQLENLGGKSVAVNPFALQPGQEFQRTVTPDALLSAETTRRGQNMADTRAREGNAIAAGGKWQFDSARGIQINPLTGEWRNLKDASGKTLDPKGSNAEQAANSASLAYRTIENMLKHPGLDTAIGLSGQVDPRNFVWGTEAQGARALIEQAQGQAFLQAFESLKGGGQITQVEGDKATAAIARLQRAQSEKDFKTAAKEIQDIAAAAYKRATGKDMPRGNTGGASGSWGGPAGQPSLDDLLNKYGN